eukprot:m.74767 g.74767  ORF g.74767 m.74767 type:complete len:352 (+) comp10339_c0_seq1:157-1212(+)
MDRNLKCSGHNHRRELILVLGVVSQHVRRCKLEWRVGVGVRANAVGHNRDEPAVWLERPARFDLLQPVSLAHQVEGSVESLERRILLPFLGCVIHNEVWVVLLDILGGPLARSCSHPRPFGLANLNRDRSNRGGAPKDQHLLSRLDLCAGGDDLVRSGSHERDRRSLVERHSLWLLAQFSQWDLDVFSKSPARCHTVVVVAVLTPVDGKDRVADLEPRVSVGGVGRHNHPGEVVPKRERQRAAPPKAFGHSRHNHGIHGVDRRSLDLDDDRSGGWLWFWDLADLHRRRVFGVLEVLCCLHCSLARALAGLILTIFPSISIKNGSQPNNQTKIKKQIKKKYKIIERKKTKSK